MLIEARVPLTLELSACRLVEGPDGLTETEREDFVRDDLQSIAERLVHILAELVVTAGAHGIILHGTARIADLVVPLDPEARD